MISEELERIKKAKEDLKNSIISKGVNVSETDKIDVYAKKVSLIVTGGSSIQLETLQPTDIGTYEAPENVAYNKVIVNGFYKKYIDVDGNTYIINENGDRIITNQYPPFEDGILLILKDGSTVLDQSMEYTYSMFQDYDIVGAIVGNITRLNFNVFLNQENLTSVTFKGYANRIDGDQFRNCPNLVKLTFRGELSTVSSNFFNGINQDGKIYMTESNYTKLQGALNKIPNWERVIF